MRSTSHVEAVRSNGRTILADLRSEPPVALRPTSQGLAIVGSAAAPVGGDDLALTVEIGAGATLLIAGVAAAMVWPGVGSAPSSQTLAIRVAAGGNLRWIGQPLVPVRGCHHVQRTTIELATDATLDFSEQLELGRSNEPPGVLDTRLRIERDGAPLLDHHQVYDPNSAGWRTSAGLGGLRSVQHRLVVGPPAAPSTTAVTETRRGAQIPLADDVQLTIELRTRGQTRCS